MAMKIRKAIFAILFLAASSVACQSNLLSNLFTRSGDVLVADDFSNPGSGWVTLLDQSGFMDYYNSGFRMWINIPGFNFVSTLPGDYGDVRIDVDAARIGGPDNNRFGVVCRFKDVFNYYFFLISSDGYFGIGKVVNGTTTHLGQDMMLYNPSIQKGIAPNHLQVECQGTTLTFYINGQPAGIAQDADLASGQVGLTAGAFNDTGVDIFFDNFVVIKP